MGVILHDLVVSAPTAVPDSPGTIRSEGAGHGPPGGPGRPALSG